MSIDMGNFLKKFNMKKIHKTINIALIFTLIGVFWGQEFAYALRPQMIFGDRAQEKNNFNSVYMDNLRPETRQPVIEFIKKLESEIGLEGKFRILIPKLLVKGLP